MSTLKKSIRLNEQTTQISSFDLINEIRNEKNRSLNKITEKSTKKVIDILSLTELLEMTNSKVTLDFKTKWSKLFAQGLDIDFKDLTDEVKEEISLYIKLFDADLKMTYSKSFMKEANRT